MYISHLAPNPVPNVTISSDLDYNQYDSQELVADYDARSEVMRELDLKTMISPSQDLRLNSNNTPHLQPTLRHDCMYTSHSVPILVPTVPTPSRLQHNDEDEMETDHDDRSQVMDELSCNTLVHRSLDHPVLHFNNSSQNDKSMESTQKSILSSDLNNKAINR